MLLEVADMRRVAAERRIQEEHHRRPEEEGRRSRGGGAVCSLRRRGAVSGRGCAICSLGRGGTVAGGGTSRDTALWLELEDQSNLARRLTTRSLKGKPFIAGTTLVQLVEINGDTANQIIFACILIIALQHQSVVPFDNIERFFLVPAWGFATIVVRLGAPFLPHGRTSRALDVAVGVCKRV